MASKYMEKYSQHEREIEIPAYNIGEGIFRGYIDGRLSPTIIVEDKFKSQWTPTDEEALQLDDQVTGYIASYCMMNECDPEDITMKYRVTRRPGLKHGKVTKARPNAESDQELLIRVEQDILKRPEHYLIETETTRTTKQVEEWFDDTEAISRFIASCYAREQWPKNTGSCKQYGSLCDMFSICSAHDDTATEVALMKYKKKDAHR